MRLNVVRNSEFNHVYHSDLEKKVPSLHFIFTDGVYRLLYEEVDESEVPIVQFILPDDSAGMLDEFR